MAPDPQAWSGSSVEATKAIHITARNSKPTIPPKFGILQNDHMTPRSLSISLLVSLVAILNPVSGQSPPSAAHTERPTPPTRNPNSPGYVTAKELPDGSNPPANADGNFIIGPTHDVPPEMPVQDGIPRGTVTEFIVNSVTVPLGMPSWTDISAGTSWGGPLVKIPSAFAGGVGPLGKFLGLSFP